MACFITAFSFLLTVSSVSPKNWRRSEWPTITYSTASLASIGGLTSPVNAPWSSQWQFCAPSDILSLSAWMTVCSVRTSVNGGHTTTSTAS